MITRVRDVSLETGKPIAILQDLQGPKIRIGKFREGPVTLQSGDFFSITARDVKGTAEQVSTSYKNLPRDLQSGDEILINDGLIKLQVESKTEDTLHCRVITGGILYDRKGINLPGVHISESSLTEKDRQDLAFGLENDVDYVALSFVRDPECIAELRDVIGDRQVPVVAKLEKPEALDKLDEIIAATDVVMVARGDLGVEISPELVPVVQKQIIEKCRNQGVPVITATQMLDSMMLNPVPTRAEVSDVANAIYDGSDAVMLSGETAFGKYPVSAVDMMRSIIVEAEKSNYFRPACSDVKKISGTTFSQSICHSAAVGSVDIGAKCIIVFSESGYTARTMSRYRPGVPIIALTRHDKSQNRMSLYWGTHPLILREKIEINRDMADLEHFLKRNAIVQEGDNIVVIAGSTLEEGGTNMLRLHKIGK
jgi:pyruvate kinase